MARERIDTVIPVVGPVRISCSESLLAVNTLQTDKSLSGVPVSLTLMYHKK